ncbi:MAG TPA: GLPGLI family protein [Taishania sp.]|nr:GLPGLI family protein [Taishania sp.]
MNRDILFNRYMIVLLTCLSVSFSFGQFYQSGKITFERKTNLLKIKDLPPFLQKYAEEKKVKIDEFVLTFNENGSVFAPKSTAVVTNDPTEMLTMKNTVYSNLNTEDRMTMIDMMGNKVFIHDTVNKINWTMTDNTRKLAGYECKMAIYRKDSTTNLYAWYAEELVPPVGPETFSGLPGTILGLATEDGGIVYFAKSVEFVKVEDKDITCDPGKIKVYTKKGFEDEIIGRMGNSPMVKGMLKGFFMWY